MVDDHDADRHQLVHHQIAAEDDRNILVRRRQQQQRQEFRHPRIVEIGDRRTVRADGGSRAHLGSDVTSLARRTGAGRSVAALPADLFRPNGGLRQRSAQRRGQRAIASSRQMAITNSDLFHGLATRNLCVNLTVLVMLQCRNCAACRAAESQHTIVRL